MQTFQICEIIPIHCHITDGHIGSKARTLPMTYHVKELALKLAGILTQKESESFGDNYFTVIKTGGSPFSRPIYPTFVSLDDYIPF